MRIIVETHKLRNTVICIDILFKFKFPNTSEKERIKRIKYVSYFTYVQIFNHLLYSFAQKYRITEIIPLFQFL